VAKIVFTPSGPAARDPGALPFPQRSTGAQKHRRVLCPDGTDKWNHPILNISHGTSPTANLPPLRAKLDRVGEEFPDQHAAWKEATVTAGQMLQSLDGKLQPGIDWRMEVTDEFANPLYVILVSAKHAK
jgi:hypothetical protein